MKIQARRGSASLSPRSLSFVYRAVGLLAFVVVLLPCIFSTLVARNIHDEKSNMNTNMNMNMGIPTKAIPTPPRPRLLLKKKATEAPVPSKTGSFVNCTEPTKEVMTLSISEYTGSVLLSCQNYYYKIHTTYLWKISDKDFKYPVIMNTVLSSSSQRRNGIRQTWKQLKPEHVIFVVAGPFEDIQQEYDLYQDIIWIDAPNVTDTIKLLFAYHIVHTRVSGYKLMLTLHDDAFVNITNFDEGMQLFNRNTGEFDYLDQNLHYWGRCTRDATQTATSLLDLQSNNYPFENIPPHCNGGVTLMTKVFLGCATQHLATLYSVNHPDVATSMLAERCHVLPEIAKDGIILLQGETPDETKDYWIQHGLLDVESMMQRWNGSTVNESNPE